MYLVFSPVSLYTLLKSLEFSRWCVFHMPMRCHMPYVSKPLGNFGMWTVHKKRLRQDYRVGTFSSISQPLGKGEWLKVRLITNGQVFAQSCLCNEVSIKTQKDWVLDSWTSGGSWRVAHLERAWKLLTPSHIFHSMHLFISVSFVISFILKL